VNPRHLKLLVLLLPLFIARSLLPIGFMLSLDEGSPRIVFCPGQITVPSEPGHDGPHEMHLSHQGHEHHSEGSTDSSSAEQGHQTCPFAFAAAAPLTASDVFAPEPPSSEAIVGPLDSTILVVALRAHLIRGPPALS
jgi:hypothetical protein